MTTYTLTRTRDGRVLTWPKLSLRECGQMVAFCAADNLDWPRKAATTFGMQAEACFKAGDGYRIGDYDFSAVPE